MNRALPSVLSPTITVVLSPTGNVYETPSTFRASLVAFWSNSASGLVEDPLLVGALPASIEISRESSPVKLVLRSIWKP